MTVSQMAIRNAKPRESAYKLADGGGMYLLVTPDGKRYWRLDYRFGGKRKTLALGVYPKVSLAEARKKRENARATIAEGRDPAHERKIERLTGGVSAANSFRAIADELIAKMRREDRSVVTTDKAQWMLAFAYPYIGERPISEISAPEILTVLRSVEARGRYETARRLRSKISQVCPSSNNLGRLSVFPNGGSGSSWVPV